MTPADFIDARHAMGLTQRQLAERLGVSTRAVQHWEAGTRKPHRAAEALLQIFKDHPQLQERRPDHAGARRD